MGLGNPGPEYADTRHNVGFWLADALQQRWGLPRFRREGPALASTGQTPAGRVYLMKPQTFMNDSGKALGGLQPAFAGAPLDDLLIMVDDFALPVGTFRIRAGGSAGGHNGLKSVEDRLRTQKYARLRIGVGPLPRGLSGWRDFVLEAPEPEEREAIVALVPTLCEAVECWMAQGPERAMAEFNRKAQPGEPDDDADAAPA